MNRDPTTATRSVSAQFNNMLQAASSPLMGAAVARLNDLANALTKLGEASRAHPDLGAAGMLGAGAIGTAGTLWGIGKMMDWPLLRAAGKGVARTVPWLAGALLIYDVLNNAYHSLPEDKPGTPVDEKRAAELERAAQEGERRIEAAKAAGGDDEVEGLRRQQAFIAGQADMIKALHNDTSGVPRRQRPR
jgi:hypothetical protein